MKITRAVTLYFSPTDATRNVVCAVAEALGATDHLELDRTSFHSRWTGETFRKGDVAVIGMPVYYGRVPKILAEFFRYIQGQGIPAIVVVVYGNRDYEDALLELKNESAKHGFIPVAAGAFIGQHSFTEKLGTGRPDAADLSKAAQLGRDVASLLEHTDALSSLNLEVKGSFPYKPGSDLPITPSTHMEKCKGCMECQKHCPVLAINPLNPEDTDGWRCLVCARCIRSCPTGAKYLGIPALNEKIEIMEAMFTQPKEPECYLAAPCLCIR